MPASLVRLKVTLDHVEPTVMRRVVVPFRIKLHRLHEVLQATMGWTNSHLYEFRISDVGFGLADQDWEVARSMRARSRCWRHPFFSGSTRTMTVLFRGTRSSRRASADAGGKPHTLFLIPR
ncbi:pRiA4b ORF-3-like protein [Sinorhizobium medicae]|nr:pRiA4b ORF-3-like protein [Sinorhizobium medicae]